MAGNFDVTINNKKLKKVQAKLRPTVRKAVRDIVYSYAETTSGATPHKEGTLEQSYSINFKGSNGKHIQGIVEYTAMEGGYNYAIAMHEWTYELGEGSRQKAGGDGMSGATYKVGNKFMTRVLDGEEQTYKKYLEKELQKLLDEGR